MKRKTSNKVKFSYLTTVMFVIASLVFYACKEEDNLLLSEPATDSDTQSNIAVEDGRITFSDPSSLKNFMEEAQTKDFITEYAPSIQKYEN